MVVETEDDDIVFGHEGGFELKCLVLLQRRSFVEMRIEGRLVGMIRLWPALAARCIISRVAIMVVATPLMTVSGDPKTILSTVCRATRRLFVL